MPRLPRLPSTCRRGTAALALLCLGLAACSESPAPEPPTPLASAPEAPAPAPEALQSREPDVAPASDPTRAAESPISADALGDGELDWSAGDAAKGALLYQAQCALCHGAGGKGDGPASVASNPKPRDFTSGEFTFDATDNDETGEPEDLALVIAEGPASFGGSSLMVAWEDTLSEEEIRDLVAFILSLKSSS